jgi:hypothetical protein
MNKTNEKLIEYYDNKLNIQYEIITQLRTKINSMKTIEQVKHYLDKNIVILLRDLKK